VEQVHRYWKNDKGGKSKQKYWEMKGEDGYETVVEGHTQHRKRVEIKVS